MLCLGLALTVAMMLILRQAATGARDSTHKLALRDAEEAAIGQIATLVAEGESPDVVFTSVAEQIVKLFDSRTGAVSRFDAANNQRHRARRMVARRSGRSRSGLRARRGQRLSRGISHRTPGPYRTGYGSSTDPISAPMAELGGSDGVAAPIAVAGKLWGALGAAYGRS